MDKVKTLVDEFKSDKFTKKLKRKLKSNLRSKNFMDIMSILKKRNFT